MSKKFEYTLHERKCLRMEDKCMQLCLSLLIREIKTTISQHYILSLNDYSFLLFVHGDGNQTHSLVRAR